MLWPSTTMALSAFSSPSLNTSRDCHSTTSLDSPFQCLITFSVKISLLMSNSNLLWHSLRLCPLVLWLVAWEKGRILSLPCCPGCSSGNVWFLGCQEILLGHVELFINQHPQAPLLRSALSPFSSQPDPALHLPLLSFTRSSQTHLCSQSSPLWMTCLPSRVPVAIQLGVVTKLAEGALDPTGHASDKDVKQCQSPPKHWGTHSSWCPLGQSPSLQLFECDHAANPYPLLYSLETRICEPAVPFLL